MKLFSKLKSSIQSSRKVISKRSTLIIVLVIFIAIGSILIASHAANKAISTEPEEGTVNAPATVGTDSTASGGGYVQFGGTPTPPAGFPLTAMFFYSWYHGAGYVWHSQYTPQLGNYDSTNPATITAQIDALCYSKVEVIIYSWSGQNTSENNLGAYINQPCPDGHHLKWGIYYEAEGFPPRAGDTSFNNPSVTSLKSDLQYLKNNYFDNANFAKVNGKPVVFVWTRSTDTKGGTIPHDPSDDDCSTSSHPAFNGNDMPKRWKDAQDQSGIDVYLNIKAGYYNWRQCTYQPDAWHQYGTPTEPGGQGYASTSIGTDNMSFTIQPGYRGQGATETRFPTAGSRQHRRNVVEWTNLINMQKTSGYKWHLITSFNEWLEGHSVEAGEAVSGACHSPTDLVWGDQCWDQQPPDWPAGIPFHSKYGTYIELLHNNL